MRPDGKVLADSSTDPSKMENYLNRQEVPRQQELFKN